MSYYMNGFGDASFAFDADSVNHDWSQAGTNNAAGARASKRTRAGLAMLGYASPTKADYPSWTAQDAATYNAFATDAGVQTMPAKAGLAPPVVGIRAMQAKILAGDKPGPAPAVVYAEGPPQPGTSVPSMQVVSGGSGGTALASMGSAGWIIGLLALAGIGVLAWKKKHPGGTTFKANSRRTTGRTRRSRLKRKKARRSTVNMQHMLYGTGPYAGAPR